MPPSSAKPPPGPTDGGFVNSDAPRKNDTGEVTAGGVGSTPAGWSSTNPDHPTVHTIATDNFMWHIPNANFASYLGPHIGFQQDANGNYSASSTAPTHADGTPIGPTAQGYAPGQAPGTIPVQNGGGTGVTVTPTNYGTTGGTVVNNGFAIPTQAAINAAAEKQAASSAQNIGAQTLANRPGQSNPFGSTQWAKDANGNWTQNVALNGGLDQTQQALQQQAYANALRGVGTGDDARNQAISSAYGQATSRLDPQWQRQDAALQQRLANQGLSPGSAAYRSAMAQQSMGRNDAYNSAMNSAIGQGTQAAQGVFGMNLAAQQLPYQNLNSLRGLATPFGFNSAGAAAPTDYLGAASLASGQGLAQEQQQFAQTQANNQAGGQIASTAMSFLPLLFSLL